MNRKKVNKKKDKNYPFYLLTFLDKGGNDLNVGALLGDPFLKPVQEVPDPCTVIPHGHEGNHRLAMDILEVHLGGGDVEVLPGPGDDALHDPPLSLEGIGRQEDVEAGGKDEHVHAPKAKNEDFFVLGVAGEGLRGGIPHGMPHKQS